jgi:hypothetical protein
MRECYSWETNTLDFKDLNGIRYHLKFKGTKTIIGGETATGKTIICNKLLDIIYDDNIGMKPYNASNIFILTRENRKLLCEQSQKLVIIDRAEMILNESEIEFINNDTSINRYLLFARAPLGVYLSPNYFAEIVHNGTDVEISYLFDERGWN